MGTQLDIIQLLQLTERKSKAGNTIQLTADVTIAENNLIKIIQCIGEAKLIERENFAEHKIL